MADYPVKKSVPDSVANSHGPFVRTTEEDRKVKITHFAGKNTGDLLRDIESGMDYVVSNSMMTEVEVVETVTIKLTRIDSK